VRLAAGPKKLWPRDEIVAQDESFGPRRAGGTRSRSRGTGRGREGSRRAADRRRVSWARQTRSGRADRACSRPTVNARGHGSDRQTHIKFMHCLTRSTTPNAVRAGDLREFGMDALEGDRGGLSSRRRRSSFDDAENRPLNTSGGHGRHPGEAVMRKIFFSSPP